MDKDPALVFPALGSGRPARQFWVAGAPELGPGWIHRGRKEGWVASLVLSA